MKSVIWAAFPQVIGNATGRFAVELAVEIFLSCATPKNYARFFHGLVTTPS